MIIKKKEKVKKRKVARERRESFYVCNEQFMDMGKEKYLFYLLNCNIF
jgi:hypothetical protein